jgi:hypothetical protein
MTMMRMRISIVMLVAVASLAAFALKDETVEELMARVETARPEDRPALYLEIAHKKALAADKLYGDGNAEAAAATLQDVVAFSKKATEGAISTGKKLKNTEITLRKMAEKFRNIKRSVAFEDQAPLEQTVDLLEKMRTDLLNAMFGKKGVK